ncbi:hypothetical protein PSTT_02335 [Puccinia striiformis]|uniref:Uncharacterized protein n=1 Tax=Puccinia striiformis TaxID=27350 RepID=A0A2S4W031_9BASI|nr:hypothetical protein PSTT_02335 [Puccinia striiformis]
MPLPMTTIALEITNPTQNNQIAIPPAPAPGGSLPGTSTTSSSTNNQSETSNPVDTQVLTESEQPKPPDQPPKTSTAASLSSQLPTTTKSLEIPTTQPNDPSSQPNRPKLTIIKSKTKLGEISTSVEFGVRPGPVTFQSIPDLAPHHCNFHFECAVCSHTTWIKTISSLVKTPHSESTLVQYLSGLHDPPESVISKWVKIIAASVEIMSENLYNPRGPERDKDELKIVQGIQVLNYLEKLKNSSSTFDTSDETNSDSQNLVMKRSPTDNVLHQFCNKIIQVFMGYVTFQTHGLSNAPLTPAQRKKRLQMAQSSSQNPSNSLLVAIDANVLSDIAQLKEDWPIWRNLLAFVSKLFQPAFNSANKIVSIRKAPKCHQLAEAITMDFLNHWEDKQPSSPFIIPYSSQQISDK